MSEFFHLQWHLTWRCSNRCQHCYQDTFIGPDVSINHAREILDDLVGCCEILDVEPSLALTGGDPMLNDDFWSILGLARSVTPHVSILGNPEVVVSDTADVISQIQDFAIREYQLSLDGMQKTHDHMRSTGSFQRTVSAIERLVAASIPVSVMSTVSRENAQEMSSVISLCNDLGVRQWSFARYVPRGTDAGMFAPDEYIEFLRKIDNTIKATPYSMNGTVVGEKDPLFAIIVQIEQDEFDKAPLCGGCGIGSSMLTLLPDDTVMACRRHPGSKLGKWSHKTGLIHHFALNPQMNNFRELSRLTCCRDCRFFHHCRGCRAIAYTVTGNHWGPDPQCPFTEH